MLEILLPLFLFICASHGEHVMICPDLVKTFSAGAFNRSYFECEKEGVPPVLRQCPENELYWPSKEMCVARPGSNLHIKDPPKLNDLREYTSAVLGRPVYLGCLFDAKNNKIKPADSFWKESTIKDNKKVSTSYSSDVSYYAIQSTFDRMAHMDISASLKLEFLGGLVSVEGSAAYLKDSLESESKVAFVLKAHYITRSETLPTVTTKDYIELCKLKDVTHVVTSITYGMDAYFVFKKTVKKHESKEKIEGSLKVAIKSIPTIKVDADAKVIISGELKELIKGIDAKLRGDFVLDIQPTTYNESVLVFKTLTKHLGEKPEYADASKMQMILTPVTRFCDQATTILMDISGTLIHSVTKMLNEIESVKLKVRTIQLMDAVRSYIPLSKIMSMFSNKLDVFLLEIKSELQTILPKIRGGAKDGGEKELIALLTKYRTSTFYYHKSMAFLKTRHREIEALNDILDPETFKDTQVEVVDYEDAGDIKTLFKKNVVLLLKFNLLPNVSIVEKFLAGKEVDESKSWFNNKEIVSTLGQIFRSFMDFAAANKHSDDRGYLFAMYDADKKYVNVYAQKDKKKLTDNFTFPEQKPKMVISSSTYNSITFHIDRPRNIWVNGFVVRFWKFGREHDAVEKDFEFKDKDSNKYVLAGLVPNEVYVFTVKYITLMGSLPYGPESLPLVMKPCSPPSNIRLKDISSTSFTIHWEPPLHIGEGVDIVSYNVEVTKDDELVKKQKTDNNRTVTFDDLEPATIYNVSIEAISNTQTYNETKGEKTVTPISGKAWVSPVTSPNSPSQPVLVAVSYHSAKIIWTPPSKIAVGAVVKQYLVQYILLNNLGNKEISSNMEQSSGTNTSIFLRDLVQGSTYGISVKVVTSMGTSAYSSVLIVKTMFKETELDSLRRSVEKEIHFSVSASTSKLDAQIKSEAKRNREVQASLRSESQRLEASMHSMQTSLGGKISAILQMTTAVTGRVGVLEKENKYAIQLYYPKYKLKLIGFGFYGGTLGEFVNKDNLTFEGCIQFCMNKRKESGEKWNGLQYAYGRTYRMCMCWTNDHGHTKNTDSLHYRFV